MNSPIEPPDNAPVGAIACRLRGNGGVTRGELHAGATWPRYVLRNILGAVGHTPLVWLTRVIPQYRGKVLVKCEFFNPLSSVKDRIGRAMIEAAEQSGELTPGSRIIEPTRGNTGIAPAFVAATKGYQRFGLEATVRPPLAFYNTTDEIERLAAAIEHILRR